MQADHGSAAFVHYGVPGEPLARQGMGMGTGVGLGHGASVEGKQLARLHRLQLKQCEQASRPRRRA